MARAARRTRALRSRGSCATRNVRQGPCGTMGCLLHDNHAGPHQFSAPMGPRVRKPKIKGDNE